MHEEKTFCNQRLLFRRGRKASDDGADVFQSEEFLVFYFPSTIMAEGVRGTKKKIKIKTY